jgi:hypothetical protein
VNLQHVDHPREGQRILCSTCSKFVPVDEVRADLDAPAGTFYCRDHDPEPDSRPGLYARAKAEGLEMDSHESDLYLRATPRALALVSAEKRSFERFTDQRSGQPRIDVPFAYLPFWEARRGHAS